MLISNITHHNKNTLFHTVYRLHHIEKNQIKKNIQIISKTNQINLAFNNNKITKYS